MPWSLLRIASNLSLDYVPADRTGLQCMANSAMNNRAGIDALNGLREVLVAMPSEIDCGEPCPTCMEVSLQWFLGEERTTMTTTDRCWRSHERLQPLRASVERLFATYSAAAECSPSRP
jgi:hypothetical protein